jgi:hypothetical protein
MFRLIVVMVVESICIKVIACNSFIRIANHGYLWTLMLLI